VEKPRKNQKNAQKTGHFFTFLIFLLESAYENEVPSHISKK